jgi:hypothetical protein
LFPVFPLDFCRTRLSTDYKSGTSSRRYRGVASLADATLCGICSGACALALPVLMLKPHSPFSPCARPVQFARVLACVHGHCEDGRLPGSVSRVRHCHDRHRAVSCRYAMCTAADTWHAPLFALFTGHVTLPPVHPPPPIPTHTRTLATAIRRGHPHPCASRGMCCVVISVLWWLRLPEDGVPHG